MFCREIKPVEQSGWMDVVGVEVVEVVVLVIIAYKLVKPNRKLHLSVSFLLRHHSSENHPDPNPNPNPNLTLTLTLTCIRG